MKYGDLVITIHSLIINIVVMAKRRFWVDRFPDLGGVEGIPFKNEEVEIKKPLRGIFFLNSRSLQISKQ